MSGKAVSIYLFQIKYFNNELLLMSKGSSDDNYLKTIREKRAKYSKKVFFTKNYDKIIFSISFLCINEFFLRFLKPKNDFTFRFEKSF